MSKENGYPAKVAGDKAEDSSDQNTEESFTLHELLEEEESLQADAAAVLGASDEKNCSYPHVRSLISETDDFLFRLRVL